MSDPVNPDHYTHGSREAIYIVEEVVQHYPDPVIGGCIWQVLKYLCRAPYKGCMAEDLAKAAWYLNRAIVHAKRPA